MSATLAPVTQQASKNRYPELFSPFRLGPRVLKNRIVMPGMATMFSNVDGSVSEQMIAYYTKRARGGVGTIILEYTSVDHPRGLGGVTQLQLADQAMIPGFRALTDSIEPYGTTLMVQLHHSGQRAVKKEGTEVVGPSDGPGVRALTVDEIQELVEKFVQAARHAQRGGIHGVEIHAGHGYLINQFLSPATNKRTDGYGGDTAGRTRFLVEIIRGIRAACPGLIISTRLAVRDWQPGGITLDEGAAIAQLVDAENLDLINLTTGLKHGYLGNSETQEKPDGFRLNLAERIRPLVKHPLAIVGKLRTGEMCNEVIASGTADLVVVGRQLIADPAWPTKLLTGRDEQIRACLNCLDGCYSALSIDSGIRCAINPYVGFESQYDEGNLPLVLRPKSILVVGGGITGLQAALTAAERGNEVHLVSADEKLGGQIELAALAPDKEILLTYPKYFENELARFGAKVTLGHRATPEWILAQQPDVVVLATGTEPFTAPIPGISSALQAWDVLAGTAPVAPGMRTVIIGGGSVGCDTALSLLERGVHDITMLEMTASFSHAQEKTHRMRDLGELEEAGVAMLAEVRVQEVTPEGVTYLTKEGQKVVAPADVVIVSTGQRPLNDGLQAALQDAGVEVRVAGDALKAANIRINTRSGFAAGYGA